MLDGKDSNYAELVLVRVDGRQRLVRYWYRVGGTDYAKKWQVKLYQGVEHFLSSTQYAYVNALSVDYLDGEQAKIKADRKLDLWMSQYATGLLRVLQ